MIYKMMAMFSEEVQKNLQNRLKVFIKHNGRYNHTPSNERIVSTSKNKDIRIPLNVVTDIFSKKYNQYLDVLETNKKSLLKLTRKEYEKQYSDYNIILASSALKYNMFLEKERQEFYVKRSEIQKIKRNVDTKLTNIRNYKKEEILQDITDLEEVLTNLKFVEPVEFFNEINYSLFGEIQGMGAELVNMLQQGLLNEQVSKLISKVHKYNTSMEGIIEELRYNPENTNFHPENQYAILGLTPEQSKNLSNFNMIIDVLNSVYTFTENTLYLQNRDHLIEKFGQPTQKNIEKIMQEMISDSAFDPEGNKEKITYKDILDPNSSITTLIESNLINNLLPIGNVDFSEYTSRVQNKIFQDIENAFFKDTTTVQRSLTKTDMVNYLLDNFNNQEIGTFMFKAIHDLFFLANQISGGIKQMKEPGKKIFTLTDDAIRSGIKKEKAFKTLEEFLISN